MLAGRTRIDHQAQALGYAIETGKQHGLAENAVRYRLGDRSVTVRYSRDDKVISGTFSRGDERALIEGKQKALKVIEYLDGREGGELFQPEGTVRLTELRHGDLFTFGPDEDDTYEFRSITGNLKQAFVRRDDGEVFRLNDTFVYPAGSVKP